MVMARRWSDHSGEERSFRLLDIVDRVLDKGIVIDAWVRMSAAGIDLITADARVAVASLDTYVTRAEAVRTVPWCAPMQGPTSRDAAEERGAGVSDLPAPEAVVRAAEHYLRQLP